MLPSWPTTTLARSDSLILRVALDVCASERGVGALNQLRQQRRHRRLHIADNALRDRMTSSQMGRVNIDLHDLCLFRVKLPPGEVCAQASTTHRSPARHVAGLVAEHPGHADVVGIVILEEILRRATYGRSAPSAFPQPRGSPCAPPGSPIRHTRQSFSPLLRIPRFPRGRRRSAARRDLSTCTA